MNFIKKTLGTFSKAHEMEKSFTKERWVFSISVQKNILFSHHNIQSGKQLQSTLVDWTQMRLPEGLALIKQFGTV